MGLRPPSVSAADQLESGSVRDDRIRLLILVGVRRDREAHPSEDDSNGKISNGDEKTGHLLTPIPYRISLN